MAEFFIDTSTGQVATGKQLVESGTADPVEGPPRPWHRIQGSGDATTLWYAVMRRQTRGVHIGALCIRHSDHHASLIEKGWEEVAPQDVAAPSL